MSIDRKLEVARQELDCINGRVCNFFNSHGKYNLFYSEDRGFPSYQDVEGRDPEPPIFSSESSNCQEIINPKKDSLNANMECEKLCRKLSGVAPEIPLVVLSREYMTDGNTLPIKITFEIGASETSKQSIYVKKMNLNRLFLGAMYHLMMDHEISLIFSESSIVEKHIEGEGIDILYSTDHQLLKRQEIRKELVSLSVAAYFLSLSDLDYGWNIVFDREGKFQPIDFDNCFWFKILSPSEEILNPFSFEVPNEEGGKDFYPVPYEKVIRHFKQGEIERHTREAMCSIYENLRKREPAFLGLVELMGHFDFYNIMARRMYGAKDIKDYFLQRYHEFKLCK